MRPYCVYIMASRSRVLYVGVTAPGRREHVRDHVVPRMIRRLLGHDARLAVVLRVRRGKVAAAEIIVVDLRTVVRQRLPPRLAPRDAPAVGKRRQEQGVDG